MFSKCILEWQYRALLIDVVGNCILLAADCGTMKIGAKCISDEQEYFCTKQFLSL